MSTFAKVAVAVLLIQERLDTVTDFFNRMVSFVFLVCVVTIPVYSRASCSSCHAKCISTRYADQDLNKGESVCIDRCVAKFNEVQKKVGEKLQSRGAAASGGGAGSFTGL